ncbi:MAG: hypothetical protein L3K11_08105 [Thermoplasmata archaeon]|nr:hypothetical protein [Thermoplasmata archaeon]
MIERWFPPGRRRAAMVLTAVVVLVGAGAAGYLYLAPKPAAEVTVLGFNWTLEQGTVLSGPHAGILWFDTPTINDSGSANGFPLHIASGGSLTVTVHIDNYDNVSHGIVRVHLDPPLVATGFSPPPPADIEANDDGNYQITVSVQAPPGASTFGLGSIAFS